jgi:shikimate dehydrogenase
LDGLAAIDVFELRDERWDGIAARVERLSQATGCAVTLHELAETEALGRSVAEAAIFVNATRVGMAPMDGQSVLPVEFLRPGLVVADTVYEPRKTKLLLDAEANGNTTVGGLGMLLWQAAIAEELYAGATMPVDLVEREIFNK